MAQATTVDAGVARSEDLRILVTALEDWLIGAQALINDMKARHQIDVLPAYKRLSRELHADLSR